MTLYLLSPLWTSKDFLQTGTVRPESSFYFKFRLAFRALDKDGSGSIDTTEFVFLMTHVGNNKQSDLQLAEGRQSQQRNEALIFDYVS